VLRVIELLTFDLNPPEEDELEELEEYELEPLE
jgi:hypothetical protein